MLQKFLQRWALGFYIACCVGLLFSLSNAYAQTHHPFFLVAVVVELLGFFIGAIELVLLIRGRDKKTSVGDSRPVHVYVFIDEEDVDTTRISLLSCKYLQGARATTVVCTHDRFDIQSLCDEFGFTYTTAAPSFDDECEQYLFTNGHTIVYPDALLVAQRRCGESISYVELNHSSYSTHALGNSKIEEDASRASLISLASGTHSLLVYTGGPLLVKSSEFDFNELSKTPDVAPAFADVAAMIASSGTAGTITSHPCCECMSHNEIDHNISSRVVQLKVARRLRKYKRQTVRTPRSFRRILVAVYMRYFWLRSVAVIIAGFLALGAVVSTVSEFWFLPIFVFFAGAWCTRFASSFLGGDRRGPFERLRDTILDCEAWINVVFLKVLPASFSHRFRIRFVPVYIVIMVVALTLRFILENRSFDWASESFNRHIFSLALGSVVVVALYKAMYRYLTARQRTFARRSVSITGSSSYESMWIVDLTHRGAAYISDSRLEVGDETPLVFRIPTMDGDSLITVVGKVTYCGPRGSQYQVGVSFKELSQGALDELTVYCSIIYPYNEARNISESENVADMDETSFAPSHTTHKHAKDRLSVFTYMFVCSLLVGVLLSALPVDMHKRDTKVTPQNFGSVSALDASKYPIDSLIDSSSSQPLAALTSRVYKDLDNDGEYSDEPGISEVGVYLYTSLHEQVLTGPDGIINTGDDGTSPVTTNDAGEFSFPGIVPGKYFVAVNNLPDNVQPSEIGVDSNEILFSADGFRSPLFEVSVDQNEKVKGLNFGFVDQYDLEVTQEIVNVPETGFQLGAVVNVRLTALNSGSSAARSGFSVHYELGADFDAKKITMTNTGGFTPCGFSDRELECVSTTALAPGESRSIEFSVVSNVSSTSPSDRRMMVASITPSKLDHVEAHNAIDLSNNIDEKILPAGNSASIGDRVFFDKNANGIADRGEPGVAGVNVSLLQFNDINGDGIIDLGETPSIAKDTTDKDGYFGISSGTAAFQKLTPGLAYAVQFSGLPEGSVATTKNSGDSRTDSDVDASTLLSNWTTLNAGVVNTSIDFGLITEAHTLTVKIFIDLNHNGIRDTSENGYNPYGARLVRWVDGDNNSRIDPGEVDESPVAYAGSTTDGVVTFANVRDDISPTYYALDFDVPQGYMLPDHQDADSNNDHRIRTEFLSAKKFDSSSIAVIETGTTASGILYVDFNRNNVQDADEYGPAHLRLRLVTNKGLTVSTSTTDRDGRYMFTGVTPGNYFLGIERTSFPLGFMVPAFGNDTLVKDIAGRKIALTVNISTPVNVRDLALVLTSDVASKQSEPTSSFIDDIADGNFAQAELTPREAKKIHSVSVSIVLIYGFLVIATLVRRRKLVYRNI